MAGYLLYTRLTDTRIACSTGGCETVQTSPYSELFGIPVAALGLAAFATILVSAAATRDWIRAAGAATALAGVGFAAYLVYVQADLIEAFCSWCLASDLVMALLAAATLARIGYVREKH